MARVGRPRRFEAGDELQLLFDAGFAVMQENGYQNVTVADILREAGVSTRSFYRHFGSKDELLCAMYRREAERAVERIDVAVSGTDTPRAALEAWIDEIFSIGHNRKKAARAAVLGSRGAVRAEGYAEEARHAAKLLTGSLRAILEQGVDDGSFPIADPAVDAPLVQAVFGVQRDPTRSESLPRAGRRPARRSCRSVCGRSARSKDLSGCRPCSDRQRGG